MKSTCFIIILVILFFTQKASAQTEVFLQKVQRGMGTSPNNQEMNWINSVSKDTRYFTFGHSGELVSGGVSGVFDTQLGKVIKSKKGKGTVYRCVGNQIIEKSKDVLWLFNPNTLSREKKLYEILGKELKNTKVSSIGNYVTIGYSDETLKDKVNKKMVKILHLDPITNEVELVNEFNIGPWSINLQTGEIVGIRYLISMTGMRHFMYTYDLQTGKLKSKKLINFSRLFGGVHLTYKSVRKTKNKDVIAVNDIGYTNNTDKVTVYPKGKRSESYDIEGNKYFQLDASEEILLTLSERTGEVKLWDLETKKVVYESLATLIDENLKEKTRNGALAINEGKHFLVPYNNGISSLISAESKNEMAKIYMDNEDWAVIASDGRVDGTRGAFDKLEWQEHRNREFVKSVSLKTAFSNFYTPGLFQKLIKDGVEDSQELLNFIAQAPSVKITSHRGSQYTDQKELSITVKATSNGDPIKEIQLFVNDKLVNEDQRGFKAVSSNEKTFKVLLVQGKNVISAKAISQKNYESPLDKVTITYTGEKATADLHILAVGLDEYQNSSYNLNYAVADAEALSGQIKYTSTDIFNNTYVYKVYNHEADKNGLVNKLNEVATKAKPEDVFVFFYAGHGVMSEGVSNDFYLALHNVTQLYGREDVLQLNGLSATELKDYTAKIKAQKQVIILDACQSGGAVTAFASRGASEEKAVVQLARSSGAILLSSTGSEQLATEFEELGHGVFTYALLQGLEGKADGGTYDGKITVKELESFLNDQIPILTEKYKGKPQYPRAWSSGQDFPLVIKQ